MAPKSIPLDASYIEANSIPEPNSGCWLWLGTVFGRGCGLITLRGRRTTAQRASFRIYRGQVPEGCDVAHTCRNLGCVNPDHLAITPSTPHGGWRTPEYVVWQGMKQRCYYPKHRNFKHYGGRGIFVSDAWANSFGQFIADMGTRPTPKHSIERINNDGPYSADNCKWATWPEQHLNKRKPHQGGSDAQA
jgi:hypothetical protein